MRDPAISTRRTRSTDPMPNTDARVKRVQQAEPSSALAAQADSLRVSDLTAFVVTADLGSLSKAAIRLGCAQSVLSRRVQMLESALGGRLFSRTGRGTRLTELGDSLLAHARSMVDAADILLRNAADTLAHPSGIVRVTLPRWSCDGVVSKLVNRVTGQYPHIRLELSEGYSHQVLDWIADARIDIGLFYSPSGTSPAGAQQVLTSQLTLIGARDAPLVAGSTVAFDRLDGIALVTSPEPNPVHRLIRDVARGRGVELQLAPAVNSGTMTRDLVRHCPLYGISTTHGLKGDLESGGIRVARIVEPEIEYHLHCATVRKHAISRAIQLVQTCLLDVVRDHDRDIRALLGRMTAAPRAAGSRL